MGLVWLRGKGLAGEGGLDDGLDSDVGALLIDVDRQVFLAGLFNRGKKASDAIVWQQDVMSPRDRQYLAGRWARGRVLGHRGKVTKGRVCLSYVNLVNGLTDSGIIYEECVPGG